MTHAFSTSVHVPGTRFSTVKRRAMAVVKVLALVVWTVAALALLARGGHAGSTSQGSMGGPPPAGT